jgi:hypothetical protein
MILLYNKPNFALAQFWLSFGLPKNVRVNVRNNNIIEVAGSYPVPSTKRRGVAQLVERDAINLKSLT